MRTVSERLARTTMRERLLLGALVLGAVAYAPIAALDYRTQKEEAYVEAVTERASARLERSVAQRIAAAAADSSAVEDMESWGFQAANTPVAQVLIERRLLEAATAARLTRLRINVDTELETEGPTTWLGAEVEADLLWRGIFAFLDTLTGWPEGFRVTGFSYEVRPVPPGMEGLEMQLSPGTVRIGLAFPVEVEDAGTDDDPNAGRVVHAAPPAAGDGMFDTGPAR